MNPETLAYFLLLGQTAENAVQAQPLTVPSESLPISSKVDLALILPLEVKAASEAALIYRYLFVFENFLREFIKDTLAEDAELDWWDKKVPDDIKREVRASKENDEVKSWMAMGIREEIALTTYPQLLKIVDHRWKDDFSDLVKDKSLIQEARHIGHMRNAICHMSTIPVEELDRIKQVLRDWFRIISP